MFYVNSEKLTERERECPRNFRQAQELGVSFSEYCRSQGLKSNEWHAVRHSTKVSCPGVAGVALPREDDPGRVVRDLFRRVWLLAVPRFRPARQPVDCGIPQGG
jgi:hypothetical protein